MIVEPFGRGDINTFLALAAGEGWVAEAWEFDFLLTVFPEGCLCVRDAEGTGIAFVTSLHHESSGWIGNLIVAEGSRGKGAGEELFKKALEALQMAGVKTFWLTASKSGRSLYEKHGFTSIDTVLRWIGNGRQRHAGHIRPDGGNAVSDPVRDIDSQVWGDCRETLLAATVGRGRLLHEDAGFVVVQACGKALQFGPFSARDSSTAELLFEAALHTVPLGTKVFLDAPASNRSALRLFNRKGMRIAGRNELMYAGAKPVYRPDWLYGLATMGSCG